jgi:hypothetical protein
VVGSHEYSDEPSGSGTMESVSYKNLHYTKFEVSYKMPTDHADDILYTREDLYTGGVPRLRDLFPEVILSQKCLIHMNPIQMIKEL